MQYVSSTQGPKRFSQGLKRDPSMHVRLAQKPYLIYQVNTTEYTKTFQQSIHAALLSMISGGDTINWIMYICCSNECVIWRHHKMPRLPVATQKRVIILQCKGNFLGMRKVQRCLCEVFGIRMPSSKRCAPFKIYQECPNVDD